MKEIRIKINLDEVIKILEDLDLDGFEQNQNLIHSIIMQLPLPCQEVPGFWDRMKYFIDKLSKTKIIG